MNVRLDAHRDAPGERTPDRPEGCRADRKVITPQLIDVRVVDPRRKERRDAEIDE